MKHDKFICILLIACGVLSISHAKGETAPEYVKVNQELIKKLADKISGDKKVVEGYLYVQSIKDAFAAYFANPKVNDVSGVVEKSERENKENDLKKKRADLGKEQDKKDKLKKELENKQKIANKPDGDLQKALDDLNKKYSDEEQKLNVSELEKKISDVGLRIDSVNRTIEQTEKNIAEANAELSELRSRQNTLGKFEKNQKEYEDKVRDAYRGCASRSFPDLSGNIKKYLADVKSYRDFMIKWNLDMNEEMNDNVERIEAYGQASDIYNKMINELSQKYSSEKSKALLKETDAYLRSNPYQLVNEMVRAQIIQARHALAKQPELIKYVREVIIGTGKEQGLRIWGSIPDNIALRDFRAQIDKLVKDYNSQLKDPNSTGTEFNSYYVNVNNAIAKLRKVGVSGEAQFNKTLTQISNDLGE